VSTTVSLADGVARVTLAGAEGNALDRELLESLEAALLTVTQDRACRAIVISGGPSYFSSGLRLETAELPSDDDLARRFVRCLLCLCEAKQPVVAAITGQVLGGGVGLAAACDLVLATPTCRFVLPEAVLGLVPELIAPFVLRRLSPARLRYLSLSGRAVSGPEARELGLIDQLVEADLERALAIQLRRLQRSSPSALADAKQLGHDGGALRAEAERAITRQMARLARPGALDGVKAAASGVRPPWFSGQ
jgi:enoyl-CoA hydratase/carnithine racemase